MGLKPSWSFGILFILLLLNGVCGCQKDSEPAMAPESEAQASSESSGSVEFPGTLEGAKALLLQFIDPKIDKAALTGKLRPDAKDFQSVFKRDALKKAYQGYQLPWDEGKIVVRGNPGQTQLLIWSATTEQLQKGSGDAKAFPQGYEMAAPFFNKGLTFYRFKFVAPNETLGFAWDGLIYVNGHWVIFPKPWRVLK